MLMQGFRRERIDAGEVTINAAIGGDGPPLLLLHGYPQTHVMWHPIAERLAERFTVVATDLRGYGDSDKPEGDARHERYGKRAMAADQAAVMTALGFERFQLAGHDRGARVAHRLCLDFPDRVTRAAVLDIVPTHRIFMQVDRHIAMAYYHWFFLAQPAPYPETMVGHDPDYYLSTKLGSFGSSNSIFHADAIAEYRRCFTPETVHASCEDYRAGATIDLEHDEASLGQKIACPLLALWGGKGVIGRLYDVLPVWRDWADDVRGHAVEAGHFLVEERPDDTLAAFLDFFDAAAT